MTGSRVPGRRRARARAATSCALLLAFGLAPLACEPADVELLPDAIGGDGGPDGLPVIPGLRALRITPERVAVLDDGQQPGERGSLRAIGTFEAGDRDVTAQVAWSLEDERLGTVRKGKLTSAGAAGLTRVLAQTVDRAASAELRIELDARFVLADAPDDAAALFPDDRSADSNTPEQTPRIVYPSDETMLPRNLAAVVHQWLAPDSLDLFELRFDGELAHVRYYTTARSFDADAAAFDQLAVSSAGGPLVMSVRALARAAPESVYGSPPVTLRYSREPVLGAIYYWSTANEGVMRAHLSAASASKFYPDPGGPEAAKCAGCHVVSRDGRRLAVGYDGERLRMVTIPERALLIPRADGTQPAPAPTMPRKMAEPEPMMDPTMDKPMAGPEYGWGTFNPGGTRFLYASKGKLALLDIETGARQDVPLPDMMRATHPDWSPDGRYVAIAYGASDKGDKNKEVIGSSLARMAVGDDGSLGPPELLLASEALDDTLFFPVYSPDSRWLAFARARGKSKDNPSAELFLLPADGSSGPIALDRLNHAVRDETAVAAIGNTMPTWAPSPRTDVFWLAFSSLRDYGEILRGAQRDQLWAAAIAPERIAAGEDPSSAAFWLPFQDMAESNHRAFWALADEDDCPSALELCDGLDNDCDGSVDDDCCQPALEQCGNDLDDDCDGMRDEGCGCAQVDSCDNGIDDDCDLDVDEDCVL